MGLEKCFLKLCQTATIKPRQIERSVFFLQDLKRQTQVKRLVTGQPDVWLWRNRDFLIEDDYLEKCVLERCRTTLIKPRLIERSDFLYWITTDKLEFSDWSQVNWVFGCGEITMFRQRVMIP